METIPLPESYCGGGKYLRGALPLYDTPSLPHNKKAAVMVARLVLVVGHYGIEPETSILSSKPDIGYLRMLFHDDIPGSAVWQEIFFREWRYR